LDLLRAEPVARDIDHVVDTSENAIVAISRLHGTVTAEEGPLAPILALRLLVVLGVVRLDVAVRISPNRLHQARPWVADADVTGLAGALTDFLAALIVDDQMDAGRAGSAAPRLHRMNRRHRRSKKSPRLREPPRVRDHRLTLADLVVVPAPRLRLDRLAHGRHGLEVIVVLAWLLRAELAQHTNCRRRRVEDVDAEALGDPPGPPGVRKRRHALVEHARCSSRERPIDDIRVPRDPPDVCHAPVGVLGMDVEDPPRRPGHVSEIPTDAVLRALGLARRAARIHQEQRPLGGQGPTRPPRGAGPAVGRPGSYLR